MSTTGTLLRRRAEFPLMRSRDSFWKRWRIVLSSSSPDCLARALPSFWICSIATLCHPPSVSAARGQTPILLAMHFGNKRSSNPSLRVLKIRKGKFLVKSCSLAHIASVHNCQLRCQHLFEFLGFPRLGSLGFPPLSGLPGLPGLPTPSISAGLPK